MKECFTNHIPTSLFGKGHSSDLHGKKLDPSKSKNGQLLKRHVTRTIYCLKQKKVSGTLDKQFRSYGKFYAGEGGRLLEYDAKISPTSFA
jgi:hypothetical protein